MPTSLPTPIRVLLGLAALTVEELRKLPETLPSTMTSVPVEAVSSVMQASMKMQQQIALLASKGDELISQLRRAPAEAPPWATFDEDTSAGDSRPMAAFDKMEFPRTEEEDEQGRWDAVTVPADEPFSPDMPGAPTIKSGGKKAAGTKVAGSKAAASKIAGNKAAGAAGPQVQAPAKKAAAKKPPTKIAPVKKARASLSAVPDALAVQATDRSAAALAADIANAAQGPAVPATTTGPAIPRPPAGPAITKSPAGPAIPDGA